MAVALASRFWRLGCPKIFHEVATLLADVVSLSDVNKITTDELRFLREELAVTQPDWKHIRTRLQVDESFGPVTIGPQVDTALGDIDSGDHLLTNVIQSLRTTEIAEAEDILTSRLTAVADHFAGVPEYAANVFHPLAEGFYAAAAAKDLDAFRVAMLGCKDYILSPSFAVNMENMDIWIHFATSLETIAAAASDDDWAISVFLAFLGLQMWYPGAFVDVSTPKCPPRPESCPHEGRTQWVKFKLTNPHNCEISSSGIKIRGIGFTIIKKKCDWDADVHYKVIQACYKSRLNRFWATNLCCKRIREWDSRETWTRTQAAIEIPFKGVKFPTTISDLEIRLGKLTIPANATG